MFRRLFGSCFILSLVLLVAGGVWAGAGNASSGGQPIDVAQDSGNGPALPTSGGANLLVIEGDDGGFGYNYGGLTWVDMTAAIDAATNSVTLAPDLEDLGLMLGFDAIWVDQRWVGATLNATELANLASYLATGRRVVIIGENNSWASWNSQILGLGGGSYAGGQVDGFVNALPHPLTAGVSQVETLFDGVAVGGTALFDQNFATLWGDNLLTILSVNAQGEAWFSADNAVFFTNVAMWIGERPDAVPASSPWSAALLGLLLASMLAGIVAWSVRIAGVRAG